MLDGKNRHSSSKDDLLKIIAERKGEMKVDKGVWILLTFFGHLVPDWLVFVLWMQFCSSLLAPATLPGGNASRGQVSITNSSSIITPVACFSPTFIISPILFQNRGFLGGPFGTEGIKGRN